MDANEGRRRRLILCISNWLLFECFASYIHYALSFYHNNTFFRLNDGFLTWIKFSEISFTWKSKTFYSYQLSLAAEFLSNLKCWNSSNVICIMCILTFIKFYKYTFKISLAILRFANPILKCKESIPISLWLLSSAFRRLMKYNPS